MPLPDYLGSVAAARFQGGSPDPADVTDAEIVEALKFGFQQLKLWSGKDTWTGNEKTINQADVICNFFAGSYIRTGVRDPENKSQELFNRAKALCVALQENQKAVEDSPGQKISHASTTCTIGNSTNAHNPNVPRYTSPRTDY